MGKHSTQDAHRRKPWITAAGALVLAATIAIALAPGVHKPTADTAVGGGGGNTGNQIAIE
ncbi:hypothetical protein [Amycolatopsis sp. NPDC051061]|uniref:hypothetical protein n=1 Tax=Amycolatopsis sp. NPDC051061 TaxID=3155042 RepID=UPI00343E040F